MLVKKEQPKAYRSPLWKHLADIRKWRKAGDTWEQITARLGAEHNIKTSLQSVQAFLKRSSRVKDPLGYHIDRPHSEKSNVEPDEQKRPQSQHLKPIEEQFEEQLDKEKKRREWKFI
jgi:hypothetical protein